MFSVMSAGFGMFVLIPVVVLWENGRYVHEYIYIYMLPPMHPCVYIYIYIYIHVYII